jgi:acetyl esterase/lipase
MTRSFQVLMTGALTCLAVSGGVASAQQLGLADVHDSAEASRAPIPIVEGTQITRDVAYGANPMQTLDVYRPANPKGAPIIVMVHGGGCSRGDKAMPGVFANKVNHWIPKGSIVVSVNYRLIPAADPLAQADDVARAAAFVQRHAGEWGGDPSRLVLMGHSAGAHLVALLGAAPDIAERGGAKPWLGTIALDSAAYDVPAIMEQAHFPLYDRAFGTDKKLWLAASPSARLEAAPSPMLLVCSSMRADSCSAARDFAGKVKVLKGAATVLPLDMTHAEINRQLGVESAYTAAVDSFLASLGS